MKAIIVGVNITRKKSLKYDIEELKNLAEACEVEVIGELTQTLEKPTHNFYIGSGKVLELKQLIDELEPDMIIFNTELSPSHVRNLEAEIDTRIIDRTVLILDIFAKRAKTKEAMLQVEIAQHKYLKPRLIGNDPDMSRQAGGIGSRGPGEKKLEINRRRIDGEVQKLELELSKIVETRKVQRKKRIKNEIPIVALVGYTNAGKSSFMNYLLKNNEEKQVFEKDMLFATLETSSREVLLNNKKVIFIDTVGFVSNLPHHLINSFKSTLEEVKEADLLIHVVDSANIDLKLQIDTTNSVLKDLEADNIDMYYAFNKSDLSSISKDDIKEYDDKLLISTKTGNNMEELLKIVESKLFKSKVYKLVIPYDKGNLFSDLKKKNNVVSFSNEFDGTHIEVEIEDKDLFKYEKYINL